MANRTFYQAPTPRFVVPIPTIPGVRLYGERPSQSTVAADPIHNNRTAATTVIRNSGLPDGIQAGDLLSWDGGATWTAVPHPNGFRLVGVDPGAPEPPTQPSPNVQEPNERTRYDHLMEDTADL